MVFIDLEFKFPKYQLPSFWMKEMAHESRETIFSQLQLARLL